jgi:hypothetical protein
VENEMKVFSINIHNMEKKFQRKIVDFNAIYIIDAAHIPILWIVAEKYYKNYVLSFLKKKKRLCYTHGTKISL